MVCGWFGGGADLTANGNNLVLTSGSKVVADPDFCSLGMLRRRTIRAMSAPLSAVGEDDGLMPYIVANEPSVVTVW